MINVYSNDSSVILEGLLTNLSCVMRNGHGKIFSKQRVAYSEYEAALPGEASLNSRLCSI